MRIGEEKKKERKKKQKDENRMAYPIGRP